MILLVLTLIRCHTVPYSMAAQSLLQSQQLMSATCIYDSLPEPELVLTARRSGYSRWSWPSRTSTCRTASSSKNVSLPPYQFTNLHREKNTQISKVNIDWRIDVPRPEAGLLERPAPSHSLNGGVPAHNRPEKKWQNWMMLPSFLHFD